MKDKFVSYRSFNILYVHSSLKGIWHEIGETTRGKGGSKMQSTNDQLKMLNIEKPALLLLPCTDTRSFITDNIPPPPQPIIKLRRGPRLPHPSTVKTDG